MTQTPYLETIKHIRQPQENNNSNLTSPSLSVVIPFFNESGNVVPLLRDIQDTLKDYDGLWEIIAVNDGSRDSTAVELDEAKLVLGPHIHIVSFARNFGQTAAMQVGIESAFGELIVTLDGDRQNDPSDIPRMVDHLIKNKLDMVCGWRKNRKDKALYRKFPSKLANLLIRNVTGVTVNDYGCSLKLYRAKVIKRVVLMGEMHRFIPAWVASVTDPQRIGEIEVNHRARTVGQSKYGLSRTFRVVLDLLSVMFFMRFSRRPGHFFGSIGLTASGLGSLILCYLLGLKIFIGADIGGRPLLFTGILMVITGIQFITTGVLAEMQTRNGTTQPYPVLDNSNENSRKWFEHASR